MLLGLQNIHIFTIERKNGHLCAGNSERKQEQKYQQYDQQYRTFSINSEKSERRIGPQMVNGRMDIQDKIFRLQGYAARNG
jgi:hypothetical protein